MYIRTGHLEVSQSFITLMARIITPISPRVYLTIITGIFQPIFLKSHFTGIKGYGITAQVQHLTVPLSQVTAANVPRSMIEAIKTGSAKLD